jgi:hypothetical protein
MERNSSGALRAPGAFGASGTSDHHATLSSCSLQITPVLRPQHRTRPPAAPAPPAPLPLFSACKSVAVLGQAMRVCLLAAVLRPSAAAPLAALPAPLSAAFCAHFGRTAVLLNPASLAGDEASAARYTPQRKLQLDSNLIQLDSTLISTNSDLTQSLPQKGVRDLNHDHAKKTPERPCSTLIFGHELGRFVSRHICS